MVVVIVNALSLRQILAHSQKKHKNKTVYFA